MLNHGPVSVRRGGLRRGTGKDPPSPRLRRARARRGNRQDEIVGFVVELPNSFAIGNLVCMQAVRTANPTMVCFGEERRGKRSLAEGVFG